MASEIKLFMNDVELPPVAPALSGLVHQDWKRTPSEEMFGFFFQLSACVGRTRSYPSTEVLGHVNEARETFLEDREVTLAILNDWAAACGIQRSPSELFQEIERTLKVMGQLAATASECVFFATAPDSKPIEVVCTNIDRLLARFDGEPEGPHG